MEKELINTLCKQETFNVVQILQYQGKGRGNTRNGMGRSGGETREK
jgi:hypothetical protein